MPGTSPAQNALEALVRSRWSPTEIVDQVYRDTPILSSIYDSRETRSGDLAIEVVVNLSNPVNPLWIDGYQSFNYQTYDSERSVIFRARRIVVPFQFSDDELLATGHENALVAKIDADLQKVQAALRERLETAVVSAPQFDDGILGGVDDGTIKPTYGGQSRVVYPTWQAYVDAASTTASFSALLTALVNTNYRERKPAIGWTTRQLFVSIGNRLEPKERYIVEGTGQANYATGMSQTIFLFGLPVYHSWSIPAQHFLWLDPGSFKMVTYAGREANLIGPQLAQFQEVWLFRVVWVGTIYCIHPRSNAKFTALTS